MIFYKILYNILDYIMYIIYYILYNLIIDYIIEDAMRRDTATPAFWGLALCDPFRQVVRAGLCLPIFWLILFDLGKS